MAFPQQMVVSFEGIATWLWKRASGLFVVLLFPEYICRLSVYYQLHHIAGTARLG